MLVNRTYELARRWSNRQLAVIAPLFDGDVVNVSAWEDRDKEGRQYRDYFCNARSYACTNYGQYRGLQGMDNEYALDLTADVSADLRRRFDVAFNHTTLEHILDVRTAFANLCELSRDVVIVIVPFAQVQHESGEWKDYWRLSPTCLRQLYEENGLATIYESESPHRNAAVYLLAVGSRHPQRWEGQLPAHVSGERAGAWIGRDGVLAHALRIVYSYGIRAKRRLRIAGG